nr:DNA repair protein RAD50 [Tanacetum cinerariifolium]
MEMEKNYHNESFCNARSARHKSDMYSFGIPMFEVLSHWNNDQLHRDASAMHIYRSLVRFSGMLQHFLEQQPDGNFKVKSGDVSLPVLG